MSKYVCSGADVTEFMKKVKVTSKCWEWLGCRKHRRYGCVRFGGRKIHAHRYSWLIHRGSIPKGMNVCHTCDNTFCVNPDHLFLGTQLENMRDCQRKGRYSQGEKHCNSKLTVEKVREIRELWNSGVTNKAELARMFGTTTRPIFQIVTGRTWKSVT